MSYRSQEFAGRVLTDRSHRYFLHKPQGLVTATKDANIHSVGATREQKTGPPQYLSYRSTGSGYTTGLLLLTDNGPLGFPTPSSPIPYWKRIRGSWSTVSCEPAHIEEFQEGNHLLRWAKPAKLKILSSPKESRAGHPIWRKFHQVKMFLSIGVKSLLLSEFALKPSLRMSLRRGIIAPSHQLNVKPFALF